MGDYFISLEIPAPKPEDQPAEVKVEVEGEVLSELAYLIPRGWCGVAHWTLFYGIKQIYPEQAGTWITGDGLYRPVPLKWKLPESPCTLTVKGYNQSLENPHTVYLWILTAAEEEAKPWKVLADFVAILKRLIGL